MLKKVVGTVLIVAALILGALQIALPAKANGGIPFPCPSGFHYCLHAGDTCDAVLNCICYGIDPYAVCSIMRGGGN